MVAAATLALSITVTAGVLFQVATAARLGLAAFRGEPRRGA